MTHRMLFLWAEDCDLQKPAECVELLGFRRGIGWSAACKAVGASLGRCGMALALRACLLACFLRITGTDINAQQGFDALPADAQRHQLHKYALSFLTVSRPSRCALLNFLWSSMSFPALPLLAMTCSCRVPALSAALPAIAAVDFTALWISQLVHSESSVPEEAWLF